MILKRIRFPFDMIRSDHRRPVYLSILLQALCLSCRLIGPFREMGYGLICCWWLSKQRESIKWPLRRGNACRLSGISLCLPSFYHSPILSSESSGGASCSSNTRPLNTSLVTAEHAWTCSIQRPFFGSERKHRGYLKWTDTTTRDNNYYHQCSR